MHSKLLTYLFVSICVSFYLFPVSLVFLPETLNTKMILAVFGLLAFAFDSIRKHSFTFARTTLISALLAVVFSIWCLLCITINGTNDTTYSRYWLSFATWLGGAYAVCYIIREMTGSVNLEKLTGFLAVVCTIQCILALMIDNIPSLQRTVDSIFIQGQSFLHDVHRLYGIGASLDSAGVRFSIVLILIAHQLSSEGKVMQQPLSSLLYLAAFAFITIVGSIIARTTWVGAFLGIVYMVVSYFYFKNGFIDKQQISFWLVFITIVFTAALTSMLLYRSNLEFRDSFRFAFEGFFNWAETGVFRTDSTDKLNNLMWIWPKDQRTWLIGEGQFGLWSYGTDIGYCRFTLYCGLTGLVIFSVFFIYNGLSLIGKFPNFIWMSLLLIASTFIIWMKVATDIFFIYALLFCTAREMDPEHTTVQTS